MNNNISKESYGARSIKFRLILASVLIFIMAVVLASLAQYSFYAYFNQIDYYSKSYYELIDFKTNFYDMRTSAENYMKSGANENLSQYNEKKSHLDVLVDELDHAYVEMDNDEQKALIHAICNSYRNYSENLSKIISENNLESSLAEYYSNYTEDADYIDGYVETLLDKRFVEGQNYQKNMLSQMNVFRLVQISMFLILFAAIMYIILIVFFNIVSPVLRISASAKELADGNLDIDDVEYSDMKHDDEIKNLVKVFNTMKNNMKKVIEMQNRNLKMREQLDAQQQLAENAKKELQSAKYQNEILYKKANYDNLTGIFNRNAFENEVRNVIGSYTDKNIGALMVIDVDNFKMVNDTLGHQGGDEVLKLLARCLTNVLMNCGFAGRWGGDEFVGFINNAESIDFIKQKSSDLCRLMNRQFMFKGIIHGISISVGVCPMTKGYELKRAYENSDKMLYDVKEMGRNNYKIFLDDIKADAVRENI